MTARADVAAAIAALSGLPKHKVDEVLRMYSALLVAELRMDGQTRVHGVGRLVKVRRKARMGRNPRVGLPVAIPERDAVKFFPSEGLV